MQARTGGAKVGAVTSVKAMVDDINWSSWFVVCKARWRTGREKVGSLMSVRASLDG